MASLSSTGNYQLTSPRVRRVPGNTSPRSVVVACCHGREPVESDDTSNEVRGAKKQKSQRREVSFLTRFVFDKVGESLKPKQKGDWRDLTLMSLSFAVYVYISQRLVCAYFLWTSIPTQQW